MIDEQQLQQVQVKKPDYTKTFLYIIIGVLTLLLVIFFLKSKDKTVPQEAWFALAAIAVTYFAFKLWEQRKRFINVDTVKQYVAAYHAKYTGDTVSIADITVWQRTGLDNQWFIGIPQRNLVYLWDTKSNSVQGLREGTIKSLIKEDENSQLWKGVIQNKELLDDYIKRKTDEVYG